MNLSDVVNRAVPPQPWDEGENIPWNDPAFSERMLAEHLTQDHDHASRRAGKIDEHVRWLAARLPTGRTARVLDLACGPGLYTQRLARLGHECVGIDFSPAAVAYARRQAANEGLPCEYFLADLREAEFGAGFHLAMMLFGQVNVFRRSYARVIVRKAFDALAPGGLLVLEPQTLASAERVGRRAPGWQALQHGLFSDRPHLVLEEHFWHADAAAGTTRFYVVDAETAAVTRHAMTYEAYTESDLAEVLADEGFASVEFHPSLTGDRDDGQADFLVVAARKPN